MKNQNKRTTLSRSPLALAIVFGLSSAAAFAQEEEKATELGRVEVTGSRIKKAEIEGQSPVLTINREALDKSGLSSIGDVLQELTAGGKALNGKFNSSGNFGFPADGGGIGAGSTQVDLRHLESKRVLVLVDGKRWVNESSASGVGGSVDLNTIPLAIVDRIEVLEDGASAIYGSDAIAGVINVITKRDFDGAQITARYGEYDKGDGETTHADVTLGGSGERFSATFSASFDDQKRVSSADRSLAREPVPGTGVTRGSSGTPQGRFIFCDPRLGDCSNGDNYLDLTLNNGTGTPVYNPTTGGTYHGFALADRFNFAPYNLVVTPNKRKSLFASARFDISESTNWYVKGLYNNRESVNQAAPEPIFIGFDAGTGGLADRISISRLNPYNPFGIDLNATGPNTNFALIGRRPIEGGPRIFIQDVDTFYFGTGLEGSFTWGDRWMAWDVNYATTENKAEQNFYNGYNLRRMQIALGDPAICAANPGCVPLNLFGGQGANGQGTITPEMLNWIRVNTRDSSKQELEVFSANLTGDLFEMPAGMLSFATGYEHREYAGSYTPDQMRVNGESQDSAAVPTSGEYDVNEVYGELSVPVVDSLDLSAAVRFSDYSNFGSETTGKIGFRWQPTDELLFRGTYAQGFRAPFIGELFGSAQFGAVLTDPCSNNVTANCRALGVPAGYEQINPQITTITGGNPDLDPENADSYTLGAVYSPAWAEDAAWADRLDFEVTYYNHQVDGAIAPLDAQVQLDECVASGNPNSVFCQGITRTSSGQINRFENRLQNIGAVETDGFDFKVNWSFATTDWGKFSASWQNSFVNDYDAYTILESGIVPFARTVGVEVGDSAIPEWQSNLVVDWQLGNWNVNWAMRHIDGVTESCSDFRDNTSLSLTNLGLCSNPNNTDNALSTNSLGSTTYHDLQVAWDSAFGKEGLKASLGVNNLFDKDPPTCYSCSLNGYDAGTYDAQGQFWYVDIAFKF